MSVCVNLMNLAKLPRIADREGRTGAYAYGNFVGIGPWYASGQTVIPTSTSQKAQDLSRTVNGTIKPDTFQKGFPCSADAACPALPA